MPTFATTFHWLTAFAAALLLNLGMVLTLEPQVARSQYGARSTALDITIMTLPVDEPRMPPSGDVAPSVPEPTPPQATREEARSVPESILPTTPTTPTTPITPELPPAAPAVIEPALPTKRAPTIQKQVQKAPTAPTSTPKRPSKPKLEQRSTNTKMPESRAQASTTGRQPAQRITPAARHAEKRESVPRPSPATSARYANQLRDHMERSKRYPRKALMRRKQGTVTLRLSINADGSLQKVIVMASSGHSVLDDAAIDLAQNTGPFPPLPAGQPTPYEVIVPVAYQLR